MTQTQTVFVATAADLPELSRDCQRLVPALRDRQCAVEIVVWDDPHVDWAAADLVVVRSIWDYFRKRAAFEAWLEMLDMVGAAVVNETEVIRHNLDKRYLGELESAGVPIVPTFYATEVSGALQAATELGWHEVVMKPTVNAAGRNTHRVATHASDQFEAALTETLADGEAMVQRFVPNILDEGEWSLIFFDGEFSHSVRKTAKAGEFRIQDDWGGTVHFDAASPSLIEAGNVVLRAAQQVLQRDSPLTYARVDGVVHDDEFLLMELELIEPELFLRAHSDAPDRCAAALLAASANSQ